VRLLFDLSGAQPTSGRYHGGGEYTKAVFNALLKRSTPDQLTAFYSPAEWLDPAVEAGARTAGVELVPVRNRRELQGLIRSGRFDRLYSALPYHFQDLDVSAVEFLFTIHGLRPLEMPTDRHEARYGSDIGDWTRALLKRIATGSYVARRRNEFRRLLTIRSKRTLVVVPSMHTRYALLTRFPELDPDSICVSYSPTKPDSEPLAPDAVHGLLASLGVTAREYFLIISANRWVKNAVRAIEALDRLFTVAPWLPHRVVVLGVDAARPLRIRPVNADRIAYRGYVESEELDALYGHAYCLLFPTLNEGFGYPPLEAMRFGTPVICSAIASTTEICADAAIYVNPFSVDEIGGRALMLVSEPALWTRYAERGRRRFEEVRSAQGRSLGELVDLLLAPLAVSSDSRAASATRGSTAVAPERHRG
jgi:glycosyltransferase involved in cell wall biosynthesis